MNKLSVAIHKFKDDRDDFWASLLKDCSKFIKNDRLYLSMLYRFEIGYWMDFDQPVTFNEKLQWLKLFDRRDEYVQLVDKASVKRYVAQKIGEKYVIPTIGMWDKPEEIEWDALPDRFVLKTTNGAGGNGVVICDDKSDFDKGSAVGKLRASFHTDSYATYREWPYKKVPHRIIAELNIKPETGELNDYKFFCFGGKVRCFKIDFGRFVEHHANYYDKDRHLLPFGETCCPPDSNVQLGIPDNLSEMITIAEQLSSGFPFVRVDLYNVSGIIYFGEMTFFPAAGMGSFTDPLWDRTMGDWLEINCAAH